MNRYLKTTALLNYNHPALKALIKSKNWINLDLKDRVKAIYNYVRDDIAFGYNRADDIPADVVLKDGYGQCNTKSTLLMALLRACDVPTRIHGFTINKDLQKGAITGIWYRLSPNEILHSWVEVHINNTWYFLEGVILDRAYLRGLQARFSDCHISFCGYGAFTDNLLSPPIDWDMNNTFIQDKGINQDFGLFDSPDEFYAKHQQKLSRLKRWVYINYVRHLMNRNVNFIRNEQPS